MTPLAVSPTRFVGLDVHKASIVLCAVDAQQHIVLPPQRLNIGEFELWVQPRLQPTDAVVLEATSKAWHWYDQLSTRAGTVTVANPYLIKLIAAARVKTDPRDALQLARLLAAGLIPAVWVPPEPVRELRGLIGQRRRLVCQRTQARNRLRRVLQRHNLTPPGPELFSAGQRAWWTNLALSPTEQLRVRQDLACLDYLEPLLREVEAEVLRLSTADRWAPQVPFLIQLPGIGVLTAMTLLAAIGEIGRFASAKKLVGYSGLGASVHASGATYRTGGITKQGRRELRTALVEAAWTAVEHCPDWRQVFDRLAQRLGKQKAIVALARKLLVLVWHVLTDQTADRHADPQRVARKFLNWSIEAGAENRQGLTTAAFVRQQLDRVHLGADVQTISRGTWEVHLPPPTSAPTQKAGD